MNASLLRIRLSQYGMVWAGAFVGVLVLSLAAILGLKEDFVTVADLALKIAFAVLAMIIVAFAAATVFAPNRFWTKAVLLIAGLLLLLPLLWSPVLAVVITARLTNAAVEYSSVYAQFRAIVSRIVFPVVQAVFGGSLIEEVWSAFQIVGTVIGFIASVVTLWPLLRGVMAPERSAT
jgi:hypothetical protein